MLIFIYLLLAALGLHCCLWALLQVQQMGRSEERLKLYPSPNTSSLTHQPIRRWAELGLSNTKTNIWSQMMMFLIKGWIFTSFQNSYVGDLSLNMLILGGGGFKRFSWSHESRASVMGLVALQVAESDQSLPSLSPKWRHSMKIIC